MNFYNQLECFVPGKLFQPSLTNTLAEYENPQITDKKSFITLAPGLNVINHLVSNLRTIIKSQSVCPRQAFQVYSNKYSSLVQKFVNYREKMFYNIDLRGQCYKTFYGRKLRFLVVSQSVYPQQASPAQSIVCGQGQESTLECSI